jgi:hypothetical protein
MSKLNLEQYDFEVMYKKELAMLKSLEEKKKRLDEDLLFPDYAEASEDYEQSLREICFLIGEGISAREKRMEGLDKIIKSTHND